MNVYMFRQNYVDNITLENCVTKLRKKANQITDLISLTLVSCVIFMSGNYVLKPYKWNK